MKTAAIVLTAILLFLAVYWLICARRRIKFLEKENKSINQALSLYAAKCIDLEKELANMSADYSKQLDMAEEIKQLHKKSRLLKHDMKNHMLALTSYISENKNETAKKYIGSIIDKLNKMYSYIYVGNSLMNYIVNDKLSEAYKNEIDIKAEIENLPFDYMESIDFSALLGNILDNAVTGAKNSTEKFIRIHIYHAKGFDVINVSNSIDGSVLNTNPELLTTKKGEGHGYGIIQMRNITEKYNGMLDIYEKNGCFVINAVYPC